MNVIMKLDLGEMVSLELLFPTNNTYLYVNSFISMKTRLINT